MAKKEAPNKEKTIIVTQTGSAIGKVEAQRKTLIGLALNKLGRTSVLPRNESTLGMIRAVKHLVEVK